MVRIISARGAEPHEKRKYEEELSELAREIEGGAAASIA